MKVFIKFLRNLVLKKTVYINSYIFSGKKILRLNTDDVDEIGKLGNEWFWLNTWLGLAKQLLILLRFMFTILHLLAGMNQTRPSVK